MKVVILAGGLGTRLSEETEIRPKPMVAVGEKPILWHIMKHYAHHGFNEFCLALGYKGDIIKRYFLDYSTLNGSFSLDLRSGDLAVHDREIEDWRLHLVDTGLSTLTGGRLRRLIPWLGEEPFMLTYGDGVANLDLRALLDFHRRQGKLATVTAVRPPSRFGGLAFEHDLVTEFIEKPQIGEGWINGGFMVFEPEVFRYLEDDRSRLEQDVLEPLAAEGQLAAFKHEGFWQCMDSLRDKHLLEHLWRQGNPPWRVWA